MTNFKNRNFLKLLDFTPAEIQELLELSAKLKAEKKAGIPHKMHEGKNIVLLFEKDSTRTRCAFEVAGADLGMSVTYLGPSGSQMGKKESIADTARVLGRMYDGIEYRGFAQTIVEDLGKYAGVPVWNGLTNEFHPTQILADFLTIQEHCGGPNEYLRTMRLKVAAELLSGDNKLRVSEICYMVGFSSTSYFAKCFQAQFGMLPNQYLEQYR